MTVAAEDAEVRTATDSAGITVMVPLVRLAAHPANPRKTLGDLDELAASIRSQGLFEPLIALTAAAYAAAGGQDGYPGNGLTHVIVMGHRRAAAARIAEADEVPVIVRDDLAGPAAIAAMISENRHREDLDPIAEAEAMAELARRGWRQRRIAAETGCSQSHVSKRMALLQLPEPARDAMTAGTVSVETALELHQLAGAGEVAGAAIEEAVGEIAGGQFPKYAVQRARDKIQRAATAEKTRERLTAEGIEIVAEQRRAQLGWPRVFGDTSAHAKAGCLAASISWSGEPDYLCSNPAGHPEEISPHARREARAAEDEREGRKAAKARDLACAAIVAGPLPPGPDLLQLVVAALLGYGGGHAESMRLACKWLAASGAVAAGTDHYQARDQLVASGDHRGLQRYAWAYALAGDEGRVRSRWNTWDAQHIAHFARLAEAGYEPTAWERARLAEARGLRRRRRDPGL